MVDPYVGFKVKTERGIGFDAKGLTSITRTLNGIPQVLVKSGFFIHRLTVGAGYRKIHKPGSTIPYPVCPGFFDAGKGLGKIFKILQRNDPIQCENG